MEPFAFRQKEIAHKYATTVDALYEIGRTYYTFGRLENAKHLLQTSLRLLEASEVQPQYRLRLLLLYGQVLVVDHLLTRGDADPLFPIILEASQIAEATQDQQNIADALSLLGQAHCFTTTVASLKSGTSPFVPRGQGKYDADLEKALAYQQQALALREALNDTRGISESNFQIGLVHERWQLYEQAQEYYTKARQIADQFDHPFEKTEPARHRAAHALRSGNLDQALTLAQQALELREAAQFMPYLPLDHLLLRDLYLAKDETAQAQVHEEAATALAEEMGLAGLVSSRPMNIRAMLQARQTDA